MTPRQRRSSTVAPVGLVVLVGLVGLVGLVVGVLTVPTSASAGPTRPDTVRHPSASSRALPEGAGSQDTTSLVAVAPCRLFDSRTTGRRVQGDTVAEVRVEGRCGVPGGARAVAVTITGVDPSAPGFVTAWGDGAVPATSDVNVLPGRAVANAAIVPIGSDGYLRIRPNVSSHLIVDVSGAFVPAAAASAGRLVPIVPERTLDTRLAGTVPAGRAPVQGESVGAPLPSGVPDDVVAVAATVTVTEARAAGHVTVHAAGAERPEASILNLVAGETRAASVIVPVSPSGLTVHSTSGGHVLVDVTGWFTGPSAPAGDDGLFVPLPAERVHDSRVGRHTLDAGATREVPQVRPAPAGESDPEHEHGVEIAAWAVNVTAVGARSPGFVTVHPARTPRPRTSVLNVRAGDTVANAAIVGLTDHGLAAYASAPLDVIVDRRGGFTGRPLEATSGPAPDRRAPQRVLVVSDSAFAGMVWEGGPAELLRGGEFHLDLESCRRLVARSCIGRNGIVPTTALEAIESWPAGRLDTLVMAVGYNDRIDGWADDVDRVVAAARDRGVRTIVWVSLRTQVSYRLPESFRQTYVLMNAVLHQRVEAWTAAGGPRMVVLDWGAYTDGEHGWLRDDGVHATRLGAHGQADTISRAVAFVDGAECPRPLAPGEPPRSPCPLPGSSDALERPDLVGLYGPTVLDEP